ncbi:MAG TPA: hypothetical protein VL401_03930 [Alphaproteobacteria bacterium]|jgi:hypothetical protein|nr:hypothetical protein [Alphaproteobacteria bacterium]
MKNENQFYQPSTLEIEFNTTYQTEINIIKERKNLETGLLLTMLYEHQNLENKAVPTTKTDAAQEELFLDLTTRMEDGMTNLITLKEVKQIFHDASKWVPFVPRLEFTDEALAENKENIKLLLSNQTDFENFVKSNEILARGCQKLVDSFILRYHEILIIRPYKEEYDHNTYPQQVYDRIKLEIYNDEFIFGEENFIKSLAHDLIGHVKPLQIEYKSVDKIVQEKKDEEARLINKLFEKAYPVLGPSKPTESRMMEDWEWDQIFSS